MELTVQQYAEVIADLAQEVESDDPIDWGDLAVDERTTYRMIATSVVDKFLPHTNDPEFRDMVMSTITKLVVENFVLNLQINRGMGQKLAKL